jgi:hypothetical protein
VATSPPNCFVWGRAFEFSLTFNVSTTGLFSLQDPTTTQKREKVITNTLVPNLFFFINFLVLVKNWIKLMLLKKELIEIQNIPVNLAKLEIN